MRTARLVGPRRFQFEDIDTPTLKQGEILVRMEYFSVCGSDLRTYDRVLPEEDYPLKHGAPCHECVGIVEESTVPGFSKGQRVIALQAGGLLEYAAVPARNAVPVPDSNADPSTWVLCQPVGTVLHSVRQMGNILGRRVVIFGQGPIGLTFTDFVSRQLAKQVIVVDPIDYRLDTAKRLGATHTINPTRDNPIEAIKQITGGEMADVCVDAAGRPEVAHQVFEGLRQRGTVILFGLSHDEEVFPFRWTLLEDKLPTIHATNSARSGDMAGTVADTVDLVSQGRLDVTHLLTHRMDWRDVGKAYEMYSGKQDGSLKVVMNV